MKVHFIGIGGIGVSALAQYYLEKGNTVSGSDLDSSEVTDFLAKKGVKILIGNKAENISADFDLIIHSPAVKSNNPEMLQALSFKLQTKSYPEALGELTRQYKTIAISGSHGKSTTTAMTALLLIAAGVDPTVIVGTKLKEFGGSNFRMGKSKYLVIEACEYDGSFLEYSPKIAVITNVDKEHLDYFKTFANVKKAFKDFAKKVPKDGFLITEETLRQAQGKDAKKLAKILKVPGQHNISNALAALAVGRVLGVKDSVAFKALSEFTGTWRRFELKESKVSGFKIQVVSDYGHHPTEVMATLKAAREKFGKKNPSTGLRTRIWLIFQPHQYQRTYYLFNDFVKLFKGAAANTYAVASQRTTAKGPKIDHMIITDIYDVAGREEKQINKKVSAEILVKKINKKNVQYMSLDAAEKFVKQNIKSGEVVIIMGAGNVYRLYDKF